MRAQCVRLSVPYLTVKPRAAVRSATESRFLQATKGFQAGKQVMTDEEYDQLKKELRKKGSKVTAQAWPLQRPICGQLQSCAFFCRRLQQITGRSQCLKMLAAPIWVRVGFYAMSFRFAGVAVQGPRCSIRSKNMYSDLEIDYLKMLLLNLPGVLLVSSLILV